MIVFIHGAGCTGDVFAAQTVAFRGSFALTLAGHTTPGAPASIAEFADDVTEQLAARDVRDAILCGSSMGGAIALELALREGSRVRALVLLGSGAKLRVAPKIFEALERDFAAASRTLAQAFFAEATQPRIDAAIAMLARVGQPQTVRDFHACDAFDVTGRLAKIRVPVLALTGDGDVFTPPKFAHFVADRVPGAQARILQRAGHLPMIERPAETNDAIASFVSRLETVSQ
jgi:3-oxoadipate enol-lactonase